MISIAKKNLHKKLYKVCIYIYNYKDDDIDSVVACLCFLFLFCFLLCMLMMTMGGSLRYILLVSFTTGGKRGGE